MFKPKVIVIKKAPDKTKKKAKTKIPLVGSDVDVDKEIKSYCSEIDKEIAHIKSISIKKSYNLIDGIFIYKEGDDGYYQFPNYQFLNFPPDTGAVFKIGTTTRYGYISYSSYEYIEICVQSYTEPIEALSFTIDSSKLTQALCDRVRELDRDNALLRMLVDASINDLSTSGEPPTGFDNAKKMVEKGFISMIWGPPGTGKTYTLASLALDYMKKGKRVLIMSQSNISVDGAVLKIIDIADKAGYKEGMSGLVFRYGMAREKSLHENEDFCAKLYAVNQNQDIKEVLQDINKVLRLSNESGNKAEAEQILVEAIDTLILRPELTAKTKDDLDDLADNIAESECPFEWVKKTAQKVRAVAHTILAVEENEYIQHASIVATTATKATITDSIKDMDWDVVFFDEVSMAFVPQIMVAATLAGEKLILLGDFRQLAPIVQFSSTSILRKDIFKYLHAVDNKGEVRRHPWLIMLNEQRRMHPDIASFVSADLYSGKLLTSNGVREQVEAVTNNAPFEKKVLALVDHSEYQALCYTTRSGSRYNPLSAVISIKLALKALEKMELSIGIITPYQAQARLLSAIVKDEEAIRGKLDILCSTVHQFQGFEKDLIIFDTVESEPKREAGKLFVDGEEIDDATRLVNVAVTRARGKFIIVANYNYLKAHSSEIPGEMRELLNTARRSMNFNSLELLNFLSMENGSHSISVYKSEEEALPDFLASMQKGDKGKKLTYWHSSRNKLNGSEKLSRKEFSDELTKAKNFWSSAKSCDGKGVKDNTSKITFPYFNPIDDYLIGEDTFVWFGMPLCVNNNYGNRLPYLIKGKNATSVFEILSGHEMARKEWKEHNKSIKMGKSDFSSFISDQYTCSKCNTGAKVKKTMKNKYIIVCRKCDSLLNPYVPFKIVEDYIKEKDIRCKTCGALLKISKFGKPYCSKDWNHKTELTLDDIFISS